jgi:hypothetical protein
MKRVLITGKGINIKRKIDENANLEKIFELISTKCVKPIEKLVLKHNGKVINSENFTLKSIKSNRVFLRISELVKQASPVKKRKLCANECGFYGDSSTNGFCSVCFLGQRKSENNESNESESVESSETESLIQIQKDITKCYQCDANIGLLGFKCKCGYKFCAKHRYEYIHDCTFDYKQFDRNRLEKQNVKFENKKISKI